MNGNLESALRTLALVAIAVILGYALVHGWG